MVLVSGTDNEFFNDEIISTTIWGIYVLNILFAK